MTQIACSPDLSSFYGFWMRILLLLLYFLLLAGWFIYLFWGKGGGARCWSGRFFYRHVYYYLISLAGMLDSERFKSNTFMLPDCISEML